VVRSLGCTPITDTAAADLVNLWDGRIERGGTEVNADRLIDDLFQNFQNLADFPDIGTSRTYLPADSLAFPYQEHMIFYRKSAEGVDILHVLYGGMDLATYFAESE